MAAVKELVDSSDIVDETFPLLVLQSLERLRKQESLCDVAIKCGTKRLMAHKVILAAASHYFNAMFTNGMSETTLHEVSYSYVCHSLNNRYFAESY